MLGLCVMVGLILLTLLWGVANIRRVSFFPLNRLLLRFVSSGTTCSAKSSVLTVPNVDSATALSQQFPTALVNGRPRTGAPRMLRAI